LEPFLPSRTPGADDRSTLGVQRPADESGSWSGASVLPRDHDRDGRAELVAAAREIGRPHFFPGTATGPAGTGPTALTVSDPGLGNRPCFAAALAD
jgi:hypothetical protein